MVKLISQKFNGDVIQLRSSWDNFKSAIDSSKDRSEVDKFNYLQLYVAYCFGSIQGVRDYHYPKLTIRLLLK